MSKYTFFVDESCHLEHDASPIMCVGAIKVPDESIVKYKEDIKAIKRKYGLNEQIEFIGFVLSREFDTCKIQFLMQKVL